MKTLMTSYFPDLNVWMALSVAGHSHSGEAWNWFRVLPADARLIFCRYTQVGLLRLLTNQTVMGDQTLTLRQAWAVYDQWLNDPRVEFHPEPHGLDVAFRTATAPFAGQRASKWIGDCYLLAHARESGAPLVTFDQALLALARKRNQTAILPG
jgi:toxin-antitoxin system PIN domain toxin